MKKGWISVAEKIIALAGISLLFCSCRHVDCSMEQDGIYSILQGKKITFLTSQSQYLDEYSLMAAAVREIYRCDVEFQVVPDNEYASFLKLKLATTEVPDVFEYSCPAQNQEIDASRYCIDLSGEQWVSRLVNADSVKDLEDGKIYAMPRDAVSGYRAVYYNASVMEACGIDDPHPKTYREFLELLETVKTKKEEVIPFYETNANSQTAKMFITCGFSAVLGDKAEDTFLKLSENKLKWTEIPEFITVLTRYENLIKKGYVNDDHASAEYETAVDMLGREKAAMYLSTERFASDMGVKYPGCRLGAFVLPYADNDILFISKSVTALFIPKDGEQLETAKAFLAVWSQPEIQNMFLFRRETLSVFNDITGRKVVDCLQKMTDEYVGTGNYIYPMDEWLPEYNMVLKELWKEDEDKTSAEILRDFQYKYEDYIKSTVGR